MPITVIDKIKPKNNNRFYLIDIEDIEFEGEDADIKIKELINEKKIYHLNSQEPLENIIWFDNSNYTNENTDSNNNELKAIISNLTNEINILKSRVEFLEMYKSEPVLPDTDEQPCIYSEDDHILLFEDNINILLEKYIDEAIYINPIFFENQQQILLENNNYLSMEVQ